MSNNIDERRTRDNHLLFCLYSLDGDVPTDAFGGPFVGDVFPLDRFTENLRSARPFMPAVVATKHLQPDLTQIDGVDSRLIQEAVCWLIACPQSGYVLVLQLQVDCTAHELTDIIASTCFRKTQLSHAGLSLLRATLENEDVSGISHVDQVDRLSLGRDVHQILVVSDNLLQDLLDHTVQDGSSVLAVRLKPLLSPGLSRSRVSMGVSLN